MVLLALLSSRLVDVARDRAARAAPIRGLPSAWPSSSPCRASRRTSARRGSLAGDATRGRAQRLAASGARLERDARDREHQGIAPSQHRARHDRRDGPRVLLLDVGARLDLVGLVRRARSARRARVGQSDARAQAQSVRRAAAGRLAGASPRRSAPATASPARSRSSSRRAAEPMKSEMQRVVADEQLGVPLEEALAGRRRADGRTGTSSRSALVARLQREVRRQLGRGARPRGRDGARALRAPPAVSTLTAQGRMSRWIVTALPVGILADPAAHQPALHAPARTRAWAARSCSAWPLRSCVAGSLVIKKIVDIKV